VILRSSDSQKIVCSAIFVLIFSSCVQSYIPPPTTTSYNYLVIDGFINAGNDSTYIILSRTGPLSDTTQIKPETHANVIIEGNNGSTIPLYEVTPGTYTCGPFNPNTNAQYRLHVITSNGGQYESDYVSPMIAPPIDSVTWANTTADESGQSGVTIYVNSHNNNNASRYYRWVYYETWEFHPAFEAFNPQAYFLENPGGPPLDYTALYSCWRSDTSSNIVLGSTVNLSENRISEIPIQFIPDSSWKISVGYSVFVQQQVIDQNTYSFFQILQKNAEQLGSIFAPQPATGVNGNIHCLNNPSEIVIGYMYSSSTTTQRIFIQNSQVPGWYQEPNSCEEWFAGGGDGYLLNMNLLLLLQMHYAMPQGGFGMLITEPICGDCRLSGTNIKPSFWPN
jgi:hypothetical protein